MAVRIHPVDKCVGQRVRIVRTSRNLSQAELGAAIGVTFQQVQKYEQGLNRISASKLHQIAEALDSDVAYFFSDVARGQDRGVSDDLDLFALTRLDLSIVRMLLVMKDTGPSGRFTIYWSQFLTDAEQATTKNTIATTPPRACTHESSRRPW